MKNTLSFIVLAVIFGTASPILAQMRGATGGMGQGRTGNGGMQGQQPQAGMSSMGPSGTKLTSDQRRQLMHTTKTQDKKYGTCAQTMNRVRDRIKHMGTTESAQTADAQQSNDGNDGDVQDLEQDQNNFLDSLSDDQKTALANQIKDVQKKMKQLDSLSKELKAELEDKNADSAKIRAQAKRLDKLSKAIQNEQRLIATALGIES